MLNRKVSAFLIPYYSYTNRYHTFEMNIVGTNINFILLEIIDEQNSSDLKLVLSNMESYPRKLEPNKYKRFELELIGIEKKAELKVKLAEYLNNYLDIEKTENNNLDFWSDNYQIGEFKIEKFDENISELSKEDWTKNFQSLLDLYYRESDRTTKESLLQSKFLDKLKALSDDVTKKHEQKIEFFKNDKTKIESLNAKLNLSNRIENLRLKYISEINKIE
ncbi:hypothetical protein K8354_16160 [Polaribacter litorisediminis]|uniref:hypothetical protein n=1 Tax=Polaribacter litorisediminis TaxID=1908341 RepID=UPI001CBB8068|nr:hypothetical protein [Polaribacter litorisediminis]UAM97804.1 hypothetical protein K8354_16160 [Polaribacter litorisediminis]